LLRYGRAGCGDTIRRSDGEWLGNFAKRIGMRGVYMAKLWGVYEGLRYARELGFHAVELNVDSLVVAS
jgi:ribonuclease HI